MAIPAERKSGSRDQVDMVVQRAPAGGVFEEGRARIGAAAVRCAGGVAHIDDGRGVYGDGEAHCADGGAEIVSEDGRAVCAIGEAIRTDAPAVRDGGGGAYEAAGVARATDPGVDEEGSRDREDRKEIRADRRGVCDVDEAVRPDDPGVHEDGGGACERILVAMTYRDDLAAAQAQNDELRSELEEAQRRIAELEQEKASALAAGSSTALAPPPARAARMLAGRVYYDPPRTYAPLLHLLRAAAVVAWRRRPKTEAPDSDSLVLVLAYHVLWRPFVYLLWWPVYVVTLVLLVLPWAALLAVAGSVVLLPVVVLARLRIGDAPTATGEGWPQGDPGEQSAAIALWVLLSATMPVLLPVFFTLLGVAEDAAPTSE
jgi:hypothetical protein